jgi:ATP-dependent Clp protease ATP-binding subunit ClpA
LLNRLGDNVLVFDLLRPEFITGICRKFLTALASSALEKRGLTLTFPGDQVVELVRRLMLVGDNMLFGGRRIKTILEAVVERPLNRWIFFERPAAESTLAVTVAQDGLTILVNGKAVT